MKRFLAKIGRFFWSWGFLKFVLWAVTLIVLLHVEEDWRGARMWAQTKAKWEARGESFDFSRLIPPPIPDSENLGAIPLFKLEPDPQTGGQLEPLALRKALHQNIPDFGISLKSSPGKLPDFDKLNRDITDNYERLFHAAPATNDPLAQLDAIYPFIAELNAASAMRPYCRFDLDYKSQPSYRRPIGSITQQLAVAKALSIHADLALEEHQPDLALTDIETELKLNSGVKEEPILVSGLVAVADAALIKAAIANGLALHSWNDGQLSQIESDLSQFDFLAGYQFAMRGELTGHSIPTLDYLKKLRPDIFSLLNRFANLPRSESLSDRTQDAVFNLWPSGWLDQNKSACANILFESVSSVDPQLHRAFPQRSEELVSRVRQSARRWDGIAPWKIFSTLTLGSITNATVAFTRGQVMFDQTRIACALERYRLAHGVYPATLDELAPAYIAEVPHDVINGEPYRYRLRPDGTFLLYSVGWNEKDEDGLVVTTAPNPNDPDDSRYKHGDWVWPTHKPLSGWPKATGGSREMPDDLLRASRVRTIKLSGPPKMRRS